MNSTAKLVNLQRSEVAAYKAGKKAAEQHLQFAQDRIFELESERQVHKAVPVPFPQESEDSHYLGRKGLDPSPGLTKREIGLDTVNLVSVRRLKELEKETQQPSGMRGNHALEMS